MRVLAIVVAAGVGIVVWLISRRKRRLSYASKDSDRVGKIENTPVHDGTFVNGESGILISSQDHSATKPPGGLHGPTFSEHSETGTVAEPEPKSEAIPKSNSDVGAGTQPADDEIYESPTPTKHRQKLENRGGRPREIRPRQQEATASTTKPVRKPEIVCWQRQREWILAVEFRDGLSSRDNGQVFQDDQVLERDEQEPACFSLKDIKGQVKVISEDDEFLIDLRDDCLLFKLTGRNDGRRVNRASIGSYLAVVPLAWTRDERSGIPPVAPEPVSLDGFLAHSFNLTTDSDVIAFKDEFGVIKEISRDAPSFELVGNRLKDYNEHVGPLFGGGPPQIRATDTHTWENVSTIVIGEEGGGTNRWRKSFEPELRGMTQTLPGDLERRKGGWYFLRFYDFNDDLLDSLDFRFIGGLTDITVTQPCILPVNEGHKDATIEFRHDQTCAISPGQGLRRLSLARTAEGTSVTIPPDPAFDCTHWISKVGSSVEVEVGVLVERLWWSLVDGNSVAPNWFDVPIAVNRRDFKPTSAVALDFHFPRARWVDEVKVGFNEASKHRYPIKVEQRQLTIPLREFGGAQELSDRSSTAKLKVWINAEVATVCVVLPQYIRPPVKPPVVVSPPQPEPLFRPSCLTCDHAKKVGEKVKCRLGMWRDTIRGNELFVDFNTDRGHRGYWCARWCGEYYDVNGEYRST